MAITNYFITVKAISFALTVTTIVFNNCTSSIITKSVKETKLIYSYPLIQILEGKIYFSNLKDTISIFYFDNYILYKLPTSKSFETEENIPGTEPYFLYNKDYSNGFLFRSKYDNFGTKLSVDSFLLNRGMKGRDFEIPPDSLWKLFENIKNPSNTFEKYVPLKSSDENSFDSIYCYYTKTMKDVDYSFSKKIDSIKDMKLYRIRLLFNQKYSSVYKLMFPKREFLFEIQKVLTNNPKDILDLIERFKNITSD